MPEFWSKMWEWLPEILPILLHASLMTIKVATGALVLALVLGLFVAAARLSPLRVVLPPLANYAVGLFEDTALCSIMAAPELMLPAKDLASSSFLPMHAFVLAAAFYYIMSFPMMRGVEYLEARMGPGRS